MSLPGDYEGEMGRFRRISEQDIESLMTGREAGEDLDGLARLFRAVKATALEAPDPATEQRHLAAIVEAAHLTEGEPRGLTPNARRKGMLATLLGPLWAKIAVVGVSAAVATGGLAAADQLPQPAQDAIARAAQTVGINLPSSTDADRATAGEDSEESEDGRPEDADSKRVDGAVREVLEDGTVEGRDKGDAVSDAASQNRQDEGKRPEVDTPAGDPSEFGPDNHPEGNPTEFGSDNHPTGNPGYGPDNTPGGSRP